MIKKYVWKLLSSDGLLKEVPTTGPYYDEDSITKYHDTEAEAIAEYQRFSKVNSYGVPDELVLLTVWMV